MVNSKKGAMELSMSTIVIVVLAMSMLILGLVLVRTIFDTSTDSVKAVDEKVKSEINEIFLDEELKTIVVIPSNREVRMEQGEEGGFAVSLRNSDQSNVQTLKFTTSIVEDSVCGDISDDWIILGKTGETTLGPGQQMENPVFIKLRIPADTPPACVFRVNVAITGGVAPSSIDVDVYVEPN